VRGLRFGRRGFGFGHLFGLLFLARHPIFIVVVVVVVAGLYLWNRNRR
jgi:4-amino-4-deoxy-L-arabinose transferase-like glycosyltransferase